MADFNEQIHRLWDEWSEETGQDAGNPGEFVDWAVSRGKLQPRPQDIKQILRRQVTTALRQAKRYDEAGGFSYRALQSVTLFEGDLPVKYYFDTDAGGTRTLRQKSTRQRRDAIANDVYRAVCDIEHMNRVHRDDPQLTFHLDFADDVADLRAAEHLRDDGDEEVA
jgi:hypothetical protein